MKAWAVGNEDAYDSGTVIVFANSRSEAKKIGMKSDCFFDLEWTEVYCRRLPEMDDKNERQEPHMLNGESIPDQRAMRRLGWYHFEFGTSDKCESCGLYPWPDIPESRLTEHADGIYTCQECREKKP
jgi:hypothetical protein